MKKAVVILLIFFMSIVFVGSIQAVDIHGFISQGYLKSDKNNFFADTSHGTWAFSEMGINFATDVTDELHLGMQFFARDLGDLGHDQINLDWAFADYRFKDYLGFRAGKMKIANGLYNETRDIDMLRTSVFLPQGVYPESWRDALTAVKGVGIYGNIPANFLGSFNYQFQAGTIYTPADGGLAKYAESRLPFDIDRIDNRYMWGGQLQWFTPLSGLRLGGTWLSFDWDAFGTSKGLPLFGYSPELASAVVKKAINPATDMQQYIAAMTTNFDGYQASYKHTADAIIVSGEFMFGNFIFAAEYFGTRLVPTFEIKDIYLKDSIDANENLSATTIANLNAVIDQTDAYLASLGQPGINHIHLRAAETYQMEGYYGSLSYRVNDWLELGVFYSVFYPDKEDKDGEELAAQTGQPTYNAYLKDWAFSVRFDLNDNWTFKLEDHLMKGGAVMFFQDNAVDFGTKDDENWNLFAAKMTFSF